jgi:hypothetical protein
MRRAWARMGRAALTSTRGCMCSPCSGMRAPLRGARAAGPRPSVGPATGHRQARAARAAHGPAWAEQRLPSCVCDIGMRSPCSGMRAPCEAPGWPGRALPSARRRAIVSRAPHGPRMGPRMGRAAPTSTRGCMCSPCGGMRAHARRLGGRAAPFRWPVAGRRQSRAACAAHGPAWADARAGAPALLSRVVCRVCFCRPVSVCFNDSLLLGIGSTRRGQRASWQRCAAMRGQSRPAPECPEHAESRRSPYPAP